MSHPRKHKPSRSLIGIIIIGTYDWNHHRYYHRYYGWNPGAAAADTAIGLAALPFAVTTGGWPYGGYYGSPYYGSYAYYGGPPYGYYGGMYTGRSIGYSSHLHGGAHK